METKTITYKIISCEKRPCNPTIGHFEVARVIIEAPNGKQYAGISTSLNFKNLEWWEEYKFKIAEQDALLKLVPDFLGIDD